MECLHKINSTISSFLPPLEQLPVFKLPPALLQAEGNLVDTLFKDTKGEDLKRIAIEQEEIKISYGQLISNVNSVANAFLSQGLKLGDRVLVFLPIIHEFFPILFGTIKAGGIAAITPPLPDESTKIFLNLVTPSFVVINSELTNVKNVLDNTSAVVILINKKSDVKLDIPADKILFLEDLLAYPSEFDKILTKGASAALMAFTSGSSGVPKGCLGLHASYITIFSNHNIPVDEAQCNALATSGTIASSFTVFKSKARFIISIDSSPKSIFQALQKGVTILGAIPPVFNQILQEINKDPVAWENCSRSLKYCLCVGEHIDENFIKRWEQTSKKKIINAYGTTEIMAAFTPAPDMPIGSFGKPIPFCECEILDKDYNPVSPGTPGLIATKGFAGCIYWGNTEKQSYFVKNGWNIPGDIGKKDEKGFFYYLGREQDMLEVIIKSGGNVSALELEGILRVEPRIVEVAVVGKKTLEERPDGKLTLITAYVQTDVIIRPKEEHKQLEQELIKLVASKTDRPLDEVQFVTSLPVLPNGKINRKALRDTTNYPYIALPSSQK